MKGRRADRARLVTSPLARTGADIIALPDRPLRRLPSGAAFAVLAALLLALAWSVRIGFDRGATTNAAPVVTGARAEPTGESPGDLALYARINARVAGGDDYYAAALAEQRANGYPVRPFVTVRLPTLALANAQAGRAIAGLAVVALLVANLAAWQRALVANALLPERVAALLLLFIAGTAAFEPRAPLLHELVAGLLASLALALLRPRLGLPAWLALAAALAVRELALPLVLLVVGFTLAERHWRQAGALAVLLALFAGLLLLHRFEVAEQLLPGDRASPGWAAFIGPRLFFDSLLRFPPFVLFPPPLAAPLALLPLAGWIALGGRLGLVATLWFVGFALMMGLLARAENFYWVLMILPAYAAGLAFVPRAVADLVHATRSGAR